jgi:hypothetical protein
LRIFADRIETCFMPSENKFFRKFENGTQKKAEKHCSRQI